MNRMSIMFSCLLFVIGLSSCSTVQTTRNTVPKICDEDGCTKYGTKYSREDVFNKVAEMVNENEGQWYKICDGSPETMDCTSDTMMFVQMVRGIIPAPVIVTQMSVDDVELNKNRFEIRYSSNVKSHAFGVDAHCSSEEAVIKFKKKYIFWRKTPYMCQWVDVKGTNNEKLTFDFINFTNGKLGGYYDLISTGDMGVNTNNGYVVITLNHSL